MNNVLQQAKRVHIVGVGGIGVSAIARMLLAEGKRVTGFDTKRSRVTDELERLGIKMSICPNDSSLPPGTDLIIYSMAVQIADSAFMELLARMSVPSMSYPEALGLISKDKFTIAVAGTHGKTTTTAMIAKIMIEAGLDPTVIVGSILLDRGTNFIQGKSKTARLGGSSVGYLVVEADEYRRAFLNLWPQILVITNIGIDHLDYYQDAEDIRDAFAELASHLSGDGVLLLSKQDLDIRSVLTRSPVSAIDWSALPPPPLAVPGLHNRQNAQAALAVAGALKIPREKAEQSLANFQSPWRRFEYKGRTKEGSAVYDDYAHNPDKIKAALQGAREEFPAKKIIVVFEPHLYSRTKSLLARFAESFTGADEVLLVPIHGAREAYDPTITTEILAEKMREHHKRVFVFPDFDAVEEYLHGVLTPECVVMAMGAGPVTELAAKLVLI